MFQKATKTKSKLRAALFGPSGAGKTFTALRMATGMGGRIAVIDTERGSASKYADRFTFDVCDLEDRSVDGYVQAIREAGRAGYDVLVVDSLTHGWKHLLDKVETIARAKFKGNTWSAWSDGNKDQDALIEAILDYPGHIIATMRSKTEWQTEQGSNGKSKPIRVGLAPEQGKGIEYEFDFLCEITVEHQLTVIKDRSGKFQDQIIDKPGEEFGKALSDWLSEGEAPVVPVEDPAKALAEAKARAVTTVTAYCERNGITDPKHAITLIKAAVQHTLGRNKAETPEEMDRVVESILKDSYIPDTCEPMPI